LAYIILTCTIDIMHAELYLNANIIMLVNDIKNPIL